MQRLRSLDERIARLEGFVATVVLLSMVVVASTQAVLFNIAEHGVAWAASGLEAMSWTDTFLQKGTLWLAFIGASLATHDDKHIAIDVLTKIVPPRGAAIMRMLAAFGSGIVALVLARVFFEACLASDATVPFDYEVLTADGPTHVCDASAAELGTTHAPPVFCAMRRVLGAMHVPVSSGAGIAQLIVPVMFVVIGLRLVAKAGGAALAIGRDEPVAGEGTNPEKH